MTLVHKLSRLNPYSTEVNIRERELGSIISVRTSERIGYKRCRRKWWFQSENQLNLEPITDGVHFWLGTGFHYAMEQHYGHQQMTAKEAAKAYYTHTKHNYPPESIDEPYKLLQGMIKNFVPWHDLMLGHFTTMKDSHGQPLVEVNLSVPLNMNIDGHPVHYSATIDRIVTDPSGGIWIVDYKTAAKFNTDKLANDPQVTAYYWAIKKLYGIDICGMIYIQVLKAVPDYPEVLRSGKVSKNKSQATTPALYKEKLMELFNHVPEEYEDFIAYLESQEGGFETKYFQVDFVERSAQQLASEEQHIRQEVKEMVLPGLSLYPNPNRDCMWDCSFRAACLAIDDGSDWATTLGLTSRERGTREGSWREAIERELSMAGNQEDPILADWLR